MRRIFGGILVVFFGGFFFHDAHTDELDCRLYILDFLMLRERERERERRYESVDMTRVYP